MTEASRIDSALDPSLVPFPAIPVHWLDTTPVESDDKPCGIAALDVVVEVKGLYADVSEVIEISNPNNRPISTEVIISMPDRATVCGYALEIDGKMRDGVVVPKEKARVAFETEQRRGADPGLVESVKGNVYRTRVYPVPANGTRKVKLRFTAPLSVSGDSAFIDIPMPAEKLGKRNISVDVELLDAPAPVISGVNDASFVTSGSSWHAESSCIDAEPQSALRVALPKLPQKFSIVEKAPDGSMWFSASEKAPEVKNEQDVSLSSLAILWDASGSRAGMDFSREMELLSSWAAGGKFSSFTLAAFSDTVEELGAFSNVESLASAINEIRYDGGSDFGQLAAFIDKLDADVPCIIFTDGLDTLSGKPIEFAVGHKILSIVSGAQSDSESLRQACGGLVYELPFAPASYAKLVEALFCSNLLSGISTEKTADVLGIGSGRDGRFSVLGRITGDGASVSFENTSTEFELSLSQARDGEALSLAWASTRVSQLSPRSDDNAEELEQLGKRFGVTTPVTSLLVLEDIQQWLKYGIEPPESWEEMHAAWVRLAGGAMNLSSEEENIARHRRMIEEGWSELVDWHQRDFSAPVNSSGGYCPSCGKPVLPGAAFCQFCGSNLSAPAAFTPTETPRLGGPGFIGSIRGRISDAVDAIADLRPHNNAVMHDALGGGTLQPLPNARRARGRASARATMDSASFAPMGFDEMPASAEPVFRAAAMSAPMMAGMANEECAVSDVMMVEEAGEDTLFPADGAETASSAGSVKVQPWMPDAAYINRLDGASDMDAAIDVYFDERAEHASSPSFFIDCAGWFSAHGRPDISLRVLTNLAEMRIEDAALLRVMAWRLRETGELERSLAVLRRVAKLRPEDSQSHRDLALVLDELARAAYGRGDEKQAFAYALEAGETYRKTALTPWMRRPRAIGLFAVEEYNVLRAWVDAQTWKIDPPALESLGDKLEGVLDCDLRITLAWDADETDIDIHVTEPGGEEAYYAHNRTASGGRVSEDITDGYGPELYEIRKAREGLYNIRAHYYASHQQTVFGPATCTLTIYTDWGRPEQKQQVTSTRLENAREMVFVGNAAYGEAGLAAQEQASRDEADKLHAVAGMPVADLVEVFGQPDEGDVSADNGTLVWNLGGGRQRIATISDGKLDRLVENMSWGEELVFI